MVDTKMFQSYPYVENRSRKDPAYRGFGRIRNAAKVADVSLPTSPEEFAEVLADDDAREKIFANSEDTLAFLTAYNGVMNKGNAIGKQVSEQVQAAMVEFLKDNGLAEGRPDLSDLAGDVAAKLKPYLPTTAGRPPDSLSLYNPQAMGAAIDNEFESTADFFTTIWHSTDRTAAVQDKLTRIRAAFSEKVPSEGGFLVPERLRANLLRVALETSIVRSRARVIPMDSLRVPFPAIDETSHASNVFGGVSAAWTEEAASITASSATFGRIVLEAKKLAAYAVVPNELVADSAISFQTFIDEMFPEALAWFEDVAFFTGSGAGEPQGFLNAAAAVSVAKETGQAADTILWENIVKAYSRMLPSSLGRAVWVANNDTFPELATMALSVGTGGSAIWIGNGVNAPPMTILGRPVVFTEKSPIVGDLGDITFVDFGFYLIGDRQVMSAKSSEHVNFQTDQTAFRIIERLDGRPWLQSAITPQTGSVTLSPFVKIAARA